MNPSVCLLTLRKKPDEDNTQWGFVEKVLLKHEIVKGRRVGEHPNTLLTLLPFHICPCHAILHLKTGHQKHQQWVIEIKFADYARHRQEIRIRHIIMNDVQNEIWKHLRHPCSDPGGHTQLEFMQKCFRQGTREIPMHKASMTFNLLSLGLAEPPMSIEKTISILSDRI